MSKRKSSIYRIFYKRNSSNRKMYLSCWNKSMPRYRITCKRILYKSRNKSIYYKTRYRNRWLEKSSRCTIYVNYKIVHVQLTKKQKNQQNLKNQKSQKNQKNQMIIQQEAIIQQEETIQLVVITRQEAIIQLVETIQLEETTQAGGNNTGGNSTGGNNTSGNSSITIDNVTH